MIITKTPFRMSFAGGGSDMASFYRQYGGCVLSTSINKYMYISLHPYFEEDKIMLKYSQNELVDDASQIQHKIFKQVLMDKGVTGVEISSTADVPSGTGLGSSSSFTVGLLHTLYCYQGKYASKSRLAEEACKVEIEKLGNPIGKQDQYAAAYGGLNLITFHQDDTVSVESIITNRDTLWELQDNLMMFYTGLTHDANKILAEQQKSISEEGKARNLMKMCGLARDMKKSLESKNTADFGEILHEGWVLKRELAGSITNPKIDELYDAALAAGATGGKLLGAGGGGFLLLYVPQANQAKLKETLGLKQFEFAFEHDGSSVVYIGDKYR